MADHDDEAEETLEEKGRKRFAGALNQGECPPLVRRFRKLDRGETTTTTGICPAISGATQYSPCYECSRLVDLSLLNLANSSQETKEK